MDLRTISILLILTGALMGLSLWSHHSIKTSAQELLGHVTELEETITQNHWENSQKKLDQIEVIWSKTKKIWTKQLKHEDSDEIELIIARLRQYIKTQELPSALAEVAALKVLVEYIPNSTALTLENIL